MMTKVTQRFMIMQIYVASTKESKLCPTINQNTLIQHSLPLTEFQWHNGHIGAMLYD